MDEAAQLPCHSVVSHAPQLIWFEIVTRTAPAQGRLVVQIDVSVKITTPPAASPRSSSSSSIAPTGDGANATASSPSDARNSASFHARMVRWSPMVCSGNRDDHKRVFVNEQRRSAADRERHVADARSAYAKHLRR